MALEFDLPIRHKGTMTPGRAPSVAEIEERQLFINLFDRRIYSKDANNQIVPIGVAASDFSAVAFSGQYGDLIGLPTIPDPYILPVASSTVLGGIRVGAGLSMNSGTGVLTASVISVRGQDGTTKTGSVVITRSDLGLDILDANGIILPEHLPSSITGAQTYKGTWDASSNTPTIPPADIENLGWLYVCSVAGTADIDGQGDVNYNVGDQLLSNGTIWQRIPFVAALVVSVNGQTGAVEINANNLPGLGLAAKTNSYNDLDDKPVLGTVATSNSYNDLDDRPPDPEMIDVGVSVNGTPILNPASFIFTRPVRFANDWDGSRIYVTASTGTTAQIRIMKASAPYTSFTQVGQISVNLSTQVATWTSVSPTTTDFAVGDMLRYEWVTTSLTAVSITLRGERLPEE